VVQEVSSATPPSQQPSDCLQHFGGLCIQRGDLVEDVGGIAVYDLFAAEGGIGKNNMVPLTI